MSARIFKVWDLSPALKKQADDAALRAGYGSDSSRREVFKCGFVDGFTGAENEVLIFGSFKREYEQGHAEGHDARAHSDMMSNALPKPPLTLGGIEDEDEKRPTCPTCGANIVDNECIGCGGRCAACGHPLDEMGFCPINDCPSNEAAEIDAEQEAS